MRGTGSLFSFGAKARAPRAGARKAGIAPNGRRVARKREPADGFAGGALVLRTERRAFYDHSRLRDGMSAFAPVSDAVRKPVPPVTPALCRGPPRSKISHMTIERIPCIYILASGYNGTLYVGVTSNLIGRILQHRAGTFDGHTKKHRINRLVYLEIADTMESAIAREKQLKRYRRDWKRNLIEHENPAWNDLAIGFGLTPLTV